MIRIVLVRHARPESGAAYSDEGPPLSDEGREAHRKVTQELKNQGVTPTKILSSPLLRAMQTAEIMSDVFGGVTVSSMSALDGDHTNKEIMKDLQDLREGETVFLVGHVPYMTELANTFSSEKVTEGVSKSGCVIFDFPDGVTFRKGTYIGYLHP